MTEPTMRDVQRNLPWALGYSLAFKHATVSHEVKPWSDSSNMAHLDFTHALLHVVKATGKLAAMSENADHGRREWSEGTTPGATRTDFPLAECEKLLADLVICAMRMANTRPGGAFDLWPAVLRRIDDKNGSNLAAGSGLSAASPACASGKPSGVTGATLGSADSDDRCAGLGR